MIDNNVEYYDENADNFFERTVKADVSEVRERFLKYIPEGGKILDAGCGSGRDSKAFLEAGYDVISFDASVEMCKRASKYIGRRVIQMRFENMAFDDTFAGIWACASLLHVSAENLPAVLGKLNSLLRVSGVLYASFKYGEGRKVRGQRVFSDFTEKSIVPLFQAAGFAIVSNVVGADSRPERADEKWINIIGMKKL